MAIKKCPLCGGKLDKNYCDSCGYSVPDEEDISALYNYDPSDYPQEEPAVREITPEHINEEIYPNRPEPMEFKVREETDKTEEKKDTPFVNPYANQDNGAGQTGQTGKQYNTPAPPQNQNPYAGGGFKPYTSASNSSDSFSESLKKYWWLVLVAFFVPVVGFILVVVLGNRFGKDFATFIKGVAIAGIFLPPYI